MFFRIFVSQFNVVHMDGFLFKSKHTHRLIVLLIPFLLSGFAGSLAKANTLMSAGDGLDVQGSLIIKKNLVNQKTVSDTLGTGTIELSGTSLQTISGPNLIQNLTVNNPGGIVVSGSYDQHVNGTLTLTSGNIKPGSTNLVLGPSAVISGTPSSSNMIIADGSGQLRKNFPSGFTGSFIFPVGDSTGTPEYSPLTLNFTGGTFGNGNYAGVNLVNAKYPNDSITGSYLKRYWTISQSGISSFTCNAIFQYVTADVNGSENSLYCTKVNPSPWNTYSAANTGTHQLTANGLTTFGTFTGSRGGFDINLTAFLEGPYNSGTGTMNITLKTSGLIPLSQPYNTSPSNYAGPESVTSIPADVVDWVLIELRQAGSPSNATSSTVIKKRAAFLKKDGTIVETDGTSPVRFYNSTITQNLYPVVRHRNHLAIMSNNAVTTSSGVYTYNFSSSQTQIYDGSGNGCIQLGSKWGLIAGNADGNGFINNDDLLLWQGNFSQNNYNKADFNFSGFVNNDDLLIWQKNFSQQTKVPN